MKSVLGFLTVVLVTGFFGHADEDMSPDDRRYFSVLLLASHSQVLRRQVNISDVDLSKPVTLTCRQSNDSKIGNMKDGGCTFQYFKKCEGKSRLSCKKVQLAKLDSKYVQQALDRLVESKRCPTFTSRFEKGSPQVKACKLEFMAIDATSDQGTTNSGGTSAR